MLTGVLSEGRIFASSTEQSLGDWGAGFVELVWMAPAFARALRPWGGVSTSAGACICSLRFDISLSVKNSFCPCTSFTFSFAAGAGAGAGAGLGTGFSTPFSTCVGGVLLTEIPGAEGGSSPGIASRDMELSRCFRSESSCSHRPRITGAPCGNRTGEVRSKHSQTYS